jgi:hypothetical protein
MDPKFKVVIKRVRTGPLVHTYIEIDSALSTSWAIACGYKVEADHALVPVEDGLTCVRCIGNIARFKVEQPWRVMTKEKTWTTIPKEPL